MTRAFGLERATRIELALSAWEAEVLPLNYARVVRRRLYLGRPGRRPTLRQASIDGFVGVLRFDGASAERMPGLIVAERVVLEVSGVDGGGQARRAGRRSGLDVQLAVDPLAAG